MRFLGAEGYLLTFDSIDPHIVVGGYLCTTNNPEPMRIVYVDRDEGEIGAIPMNKREMKRFKKKFGMD